MSWLSATIRFFAGIKYNHVGVVVLIWGKPFILEAVGKGIIATIYYRRVHGKDIKISRPNRKIDEKEFAVEAVSYLSTKYDVLGLIFYQLIYTLTGKWLGGNESNENKRMYCYEYVALLNKEDYPSWYKVNTKEFLYGSWHKEIEK